MQKPLAFDPATGLFSRPEGGWGAAALGVAREQVSLAMSAAALESLSMVLGEHPYIGRVWVDLNPQAPLWFGAQARALDGSWWDHWGLGLALDPEIIAEQRAALEANTRIRAPYTQEYPRIQKMIMEAPELFPGLTHEVVKEGVKGLDMALDAFRGAIVLGGKWEALLPELPQKGAPMEFDRERGPATPVGIASQWGMPELAARMEAQELRSVSGPGRKAQGPRSI